MCLPRVCLLLSLFLADTPQWCPLEETVPEPEPLPVVEMEIEQPQLIGGDDDKLFKRPRDPNEPGSSSSQAQRVIPPRPINLGLWSLCNILGLDHGRPFFDYETFCGCTSDQQCQNSMRTTIGTPLVRAIDPKYADQYQCVECEPCIRLHAMHPNTINSPLGCKRVPPSSSSGGNFLALLFKSDLRCNVFNVNEILDYTGLGSSAGMVHYYCVAARLRSLAMLMHMDKQVRMLEKRIEEIKRQMEEERLATTTSTTQCRRPRRVRST